MSHFCVVRCSEIDYDFDTSSMVIQLLTALLSSLFVVLLAIWRKWLTPSGAAAAVVIGTMILGLGGWLWGVLLGAFFVSSSLLSKFKDREKRGISAEKFDKTNRRDHGQVFANGGIGALIALLNILFPHAAWFPLYLGTIATVNADTWATELGTLSKRLPRLITTGRTVEAGTSGGISLIGTTATFCGGLLIGLIAALWLREDVWRLLLMASIGGLTGSLFDSLLGATVQQIYWDDLKQKETEKPVKNGRVMQPLRGWSWMTNDVVNLLASIIGGFVALLIAHV